MIKVENLIKSFGNDKILNNLNLNVKQGSVHGLLGPNGCGKTTLIKTLMGIYKQDDGSIKINEEEILDNSLLKNQIMYIPDELYFFNQYSVDDYAKFYSKIYPSFNKERYIKLKEVFDNIDTSKRIVKFSKGMQKQVAIWLGMCIMPKVIILDEPIDGLDPVVRKKVYNAIFQDVSERNTTVLISSHNLRELEGICDTVSILHEGKIIVENSIEDIKESIFKIQVAWKDKEPEKLLEDIKILSKSKTGSIHLLVVKDEKEEALAKIKQTSPLILDIIPLTLEEIFIYELGGKGYEIKNILI